MFYTPDDPGSVHDIDQDGDVDDDDFDSFVIAYVVDCNGTKERLKPVQGSPHLQYRNATPATATLLQILSYPVRGVPDRPSRSPPRCWGPGRPHPMLSVGVMSPDQLLADAATYATAKPFDPTRRSLLPGR